MTDAAEDESEVEPAPSPEDASPETMFGALVSYSHGQRVMHVERGNWHATALEMLVSGWTMCIDVTAVDYQAYGVDRNLPDGVQAERFEVVASFKRFDNMERVRLRAQVPESDPTIASLYALYPGSDYLEREVYDMFGITFEGHPDLSRILMPEHWEGHPLRKDFAVGEIPVQFKHPAGTTGEATQS